MRRALATAACAIALAACTIFSPLDYLQSGGSPGPEDADTGAVVEAGPDGERPTRTVTPLFRDQELPKFLRQDDAALYWLNAGTGTIRRGDKSGGATKDIGKASSTAVAFDVDRGAGGFVYWAQGKQVLRASKDGSDAGTNVLVDGALDVLSIAVDETTLYFVVVDATSALGVLKRMPKGGGAATVVDGAADLDVTLVTTNATNVTYADLGGYVYTLPKASDGGAGRTKVGNDTNDLISPNVDVGIFTDDSAVFWSEENQGDGVPGTVNRHLLAAGVSGALIYGDAKAKPSGLAIDDTQVYWTDIQLGTVRRASKTDQASPGELLVDKQPRPTAIVVDRAKAYVSVQGTGPKDGAVIAFDK